MTNMQYYNAQRVNNITFNFQPKELEVTEEQIQEMVDEAIRKQMGGNLYSSTICLPTTSTSF